MARSYTCPVLVGRNYNLLWLQCVEKGGKVRYFLSTDKSGRYAVSGYVFSRRDSVEEYRALLRLQKKVGYVIRPCVIHRLNGEVE